MKRTILPVLFIIIFLSLYQIIVASNPDSTSRSVGIVVSYRGIIRNTPGLSLGIEKTYLQSAKYSVLGSATLQLNQKPDVFTSTGFNLGSTLRRTWNSGLYLEHGVNMGYLGKYYNFDIYRTNSDGDIVNTGRKLKSTMTLGYSIGLGYDFSKKANTNIQLFVKPGIYYDLFDRSNYYILNYYSIEMGLIFHPQWLNRNK
ncbi:hypothetical protein ACE01N_04325 [Saccharicrinis sp. FJH2]|uniref:hypothetical protein n=1 Tax=Saccharicrinis sp. FJH65 TaxID=3344659 RepID=UPI0035F32AF9